MSNDSQNKNFRLLIVDDEPQFYQDFYRHYQAKLVIEFAPTPERGLKKINKQKKNERYDAVLLDLNYPEEKIDFDDGLDKVLPSFKIATKGSIPIIIITHDHRVKTQQRAQENGASFLLRKSLYKDSSSAEEWVEIITKAIETFPSKEGSTSSKPIRPSYIPAHEVDFEDNFITQNASVLTIKERLKRVASFPNSYPVLLLGETGVGKEVAAKYLHDAQGGKGEYIAINLSALSENTFETELFGSSEGAFTDAKDRIGLLEAANDGTLLLDEIGEVSKEIQIKLLRVLEDRKFRRVGETRQRTMNVQLIFATNQDMEKAVVNGQIRQDFHERIRPVTINIPPLRERKEDIPPLIEFFLQQPEVCPPILDDFFQKRVVDCFTEEALNSLLNYKWPGNIRELRGILQQILVSIPPGISMVESKHLPKRILFEQVRPEEKSDTKRETVSAIDNWSMQKQSAYNEMRKIEKALIDAGGRKEDAAQDLGLKNADALRYKIKGKHYLDYPELFSFFPSISKAYKVTPGFNRPLNIFICYARKDAEYLEEMKKQFRSLEGHYPLRVWTDNEIVPGEEWDKKIQKRLDAADVFVLLISAQFLSSEYILNVELEKAFQRHEEGHITIIPVIIKPCHWRANQQLSSLQALPNNGQTVSTADDTDQAYLDVIEGIERSIKSIYEGKHNTE